MVERLCFERMLILDSPVDLATGSGSGRHGNIKDLRGSLGSGFYRPLLTEFELVRLAEVAIQVLRFAMNVALSDAGLLECGNDRVRCAGPIGVSGFRVFELRFEANVKNGYLGLD